jgi:hypothetical protein
MNEAKNLYSQHMWIIKWDNKWHQKIQNKARTPLIEIHNYSSLWLVYSQVLLLITAPNLVVRFADNT